MSGADPLRPLGDSELIRAETIANDALARCNRVVANPGGQRNGPGNYLSSENGGSCVPPMADYILRLVKEVRELRNKEKARKY